MQADRDKWNRIFNQKSASTESDNLPTPPPFLIPYFDALVPGRTLDIASGDGCASLYLADRGHSMTALDIADAGLKRLRDFATDKKLTITTVQADLDTLDAPVHGAPFDNLVITRFKPAPRHWATLVNNLKPGGALLIATFNLTHHQQTGFNKRYCLAPEELKHCHPQLVLRDYRDCHAAQCAMDVYRFTCTRHTTHTSAPSSVGISPSF